MQLSELLATARTQGRALFSAEFFPPKTEEGESTLWQTVEQLAPYALDFSSVTYGAGGSTQGKSVEIAARMKEVTAAATVAHLTCVGATKAEVARVVDEFAAAGIQNLLALRGDPVTGPGTAWTTTPGGYEYAVELVEALSQDGRFCVGVSAFPEGHPESKSLEHDAKVLAMKQQAGATFAVTNLFFSADHYRRMVEAAAAQGCDFPIIAGLMPVTSYSQIPRFTEYSGAELPTAWRARFDAVQHNAEEVRRLGVELVLELADELLRFGVPGIHLYTLNRHNSSQQVLDQLAAAGWR